METLYTSHDSRIGKAHSYLNYMCGQASSLVNLKTSLRMISKAYRLHSGTYMNIEGEFRAKFEGLLGASPLYSYSTNICPP